MRKKQKHVLAAKTQKIVEKKKMKKSTVCIS